MKFTVSKTPNGHIHLCIAGRNFYLNRTEMEGILSGKKTCADDGAILKTDPSTMVFYPNIYCYHRPTQSAYEFEAKILVVYCDTQKMFRRIEENTNRLGTDKRIEMDTERFRSKYDAPVELSYSQIVRHPGFHAPDALSVAIKTVKPELMKLRKILSDKLNTGFQVWEDWVGTPNFYFNGGAYNGGIIYHKGHGYSVHT